MKKWRVLASSTVLIALVLFACLVPVPVSRIRGRALVLADPSATGKVYLHRGGILTKLHVRPGDYVEKDEVLAEFRDPDLDTELLNSQVESEDALWRMNVLQDKRRQTNDAEEKRTIDKKIAEEDGKYHKARNAIRGFERIREEDLKLRAPCSGTIGVAPSIDDVSRLFAEDFVNPFCTINNPGSVRVCLPLVTPDFNRLRQDLERLSPAAVKTRRLMRHRVTVSYTNTRLADVLADLKKQVKDLKWTLDTEAGASEELTVTYQPKPEQRLGMVLDDLLDRLHLGFVIVSEPDSPQDGHLLIRPGTERGDPRGGRELANLDVIIRIKGRDSQTWKGKIRQLPESEAKTVPPMLSNHQGGPVAVKATMSGDKQLVPTTQQYFVYLEIVGADESIVPGTAAQVKIYCQPETCVHWLWRWLNETFDLGLI